MTKKKTGVFYSFCIEFEYIEPFKMTFSTASNNSAVNIPINPSNDLGYAYYVDWNGDGSILESGESTLHTGTSHNTFQFPGEHSINIYGKFPAIYS